MSDDIVAVDAAELLYLDVFESEARLVDVAELAIEGVARLVSVAEFLHFDVFEGQARLVVVVGLVHLRVTQGEARLVAVAVAQLLRWRVDDRTLLGLLLV